MNYLLVLHVAVYVGVARLTEYIKIPPLIAALLAVLPLELFRVLLRYIQIPDISFIEQFGVVELIQIITQLGFMYVIFVLMKRQDDTIVAWWLYLIAGIVGSIILIPAIVSQLIG